jgi:hypothetical protein
VFVKMLWFGLGSGSAILAMIAWLLIGLALTLDVSIGELFKWVRPLVTRIRLALARLVKRTEQKRKAGCAGNGYTPATPASQCSAAGRSLPGGYTDDHQRRAGDRLEVTCRQGCLG